MMASRVQVGCFKQGSIDHAKWSARLLTLDRHTGTLTISQRGCSENTFYHALQPSTVQQWPHFCADATNDDFNSIEAKRTLCVLGTVAAVPDFGTAAEVALVGIPLPAGPLDAAMSNSAMEFVPLNPRSTHKVRRNTPGAYDVWILRFASKLAYDVVVQMLREMPTVRFAKGAAQGRVKTSEEQRYLYSTPLASSSQMSTASFAGQKGRPTRRLC